MEPIPFVRDYIIKQGHFSRLFCIEIEGFSSEHIGEKLYHFYRGSLCMQIIVESTYFILLANSV